MWDFTTTYMVSHGNQPFPTTSVFDRKSFALSYLNILKITFKYSRYFVNEFNCL